MTEFAQNMGAIAAVLLASTNTLKAIVMIVKALQRSASTSTQPQKESWWHRIGWAGLLLIGRLLLILGGMVVALYQLRQYSKVQTPLTTGDATNVALYFFLLVLAFYPPASLDPTATTRTPAR